MFLYLPYRIFSSLLHIIAAYYNKQRAGPTYTHTHVARLPVGDMGQKHYPTCPIVEVQPLVFISFASFLHLRHFYIICVRPLNVYTIVNMIRLLT